MQLSLGSLYFTFAEPDRSSRLWVNSNTMRVEIRKYEPQIPSTQETKMKLSYACTVMLFNSNSIRDNTRCCSDTQLAHTHTHTRARLLPVAGGWLVSEQNDSSRSYRDYSSLLFTPHHSHLLPPIITHFSFIY